jgi:hypothetical protein
MREDVKIIITPNDDPNTTTTKIISEIELGNIINNANRVSDTEEVITTLNEIISTMINCLDSGREYTESNVITINPLFGLFTICTYIDETVSKEIVKHTAYDEVIKFISNEKNIIDTSEFHFVLRKLKEVRTRLIKLSKMFEVEVFNTETKEYRKLSKYCSAYSIEALGLELHKPCNIQIIDGLYKLTFKPVVRDLRRNAVTSSTYKRKVEVVCLTEIVKDCIQSLN